MFRKLFRLFRVVGQKHMKLLPVPCIVPDMPALAAVVRHKNGHRVALLVLTDYKPIEVMSNHALRAEIAQDGLMMLPDCILRTFGEDVLETAMECMDKPGMELEHVGPLHFSEN